MSGVVAYVDVYLDDGSDLRKELGSRLAELGAEVRTRLPKNMANLTHLVWKDGDEGEGGSVLTCLPTCKTDI